MEFKMLKHTIFSCFIILTCLWQTDGQISIENNGIKFNIKLEAGILQLTVVEGSNIKLQGTIGRNLLSPTSKACLHVPNCLEFDDDSIRLHVTNSIDNGFTLYWITDKTANILEDCFELSTHSWYGGPERLEQHWPLNKLVLSNFANVLQEDQWGAVLEPYWLNSAGAYIFVDEKVPLFINQNTPNTNNIVCFSANVIKPYLGPRENVVLHYTIAVKENAREAHLHAVKHFLGKPTGHPNYRIIERPIWSTWARYKRNVNDTAILQFAEEIVTNGYSKGQFEIDDDWEDCYGALTFNKSKFGDINNTVSSIKEMDFTVTLWAHPFVNTNCTKYQNIGRQYNYFARNATSDLTQWWNSDHQQAHYLDFTKAEVREWFVERLRTIQENHGIDSFKFDAGESSWAPPVSLLTGDINTTPNNIGVDYARTCATFGDLVEVRVGWRTQDLPVFVRMIDKDSVWGSRNGLYTLITTLLQMNMNGYTMVLPDMVGGNGYEASGPPTAELFVRWLEANVFMPSIQFSFVPWDYADNKEIDVQGISKKMVDLHQKFAPYIKQQMEGSITNGTPVNAPIWWVDPTNEIAQKADTEFLLGDDLLAAPVIVQDAIKRDVYLPSGTWVDGNDGTVHKGPKEIKDYDAPIGKLPYFVREGTEAHRINSAITQRVGVVFAIVLCIQFIKSYF